MGPKTTLIEVMQWPEFRAFAERLGIPLDLPMKVLTIVLDANRPAGVVQTYLGKDKKEKQ